jgi:hypothetical protein
MEIEKPRAPEGSSEDSKQDSPPLSSREVLIHTEPVPIDDSFFTQIMQQLDPPEVSNNEISTSKYTLLTFLPVNLFLQFCRVANLYFLITAALQVQYRLKTASLLLATNMIQTCMSSLSLVLHSLTNMLPVGHCSRLLSVHPWTLSHFLVHDSLAAVLCVDCKHDQRGL